MHKVQRFFLFLAFFILTLHTPLAAENEVIFYYSISQSDAFPESLSNQTKAMLYAAYDPRLHEGLTIDDMGLTGVCTYEEFLDKLLQEDLMLYGEDPSKRIIFYACEGPQNHNYTNLVGFCSLLPQKQKGHYYIDHIGIRSECQRRGIGSGFMNLLISNLKDMTLLTLDTRIFNTISQPFYAKLGFILISPHPDSQKEGKYLRYEKQFNRN